MARLLEFARREYDLVVLDAPPVLPVADALVLARQVDATLLAVQWEKTPRPVARSALRLLQGSGARVMGVVLTQVNMRSYASGAPGVSAYLHRKFHGYYSSAA
jgi:Mrp family chromosome partitioning ATPase